MRFFLVIIIVFLFSDVSAQSIKFNKFYDFYNTSEYADNLINISDSAYFIPTYIFEVPNQDTLGYRTSVTNLLKLNANGEITKSRLIQKKHYQKTINRSLKLNDLLIVAGRSLNVVDYYNGNTQYYVEIYILNNDLDSLNKVEYKLDSGSCFVTKLIKYSDSTFLVYGQTCNSITNKCSVFISSININGKINWHRIYKANPTSFERSVDIAVDQQNTILFSTQSKLSNSNNYSGVLFKLDTAFNVTKTKVISLGENTIFRNIITYNDTIIITGTYIYDTFFGNGIFYKLDKNLNIIKNVTINNFFNFTVSQTYLFNNKLYFKVSREDTIGSRSKNYFYTMNLNFDTLKSIGVNFDSNNFTSSILNFINTKDGGFLGVGISNYQKLGIFPQDLWVVKTDSNGCFTENCFSSINNSKSINDFLLYPIPANDKLYFSSQNLSKFNKYYIVDNLGRVVLENDLLTDYVDVSILSEGTYYINFISKDYASKVIKFYKSP